MQIAWFLFYSLQERMSNIESIPLTSFQPLFINCIFEQLESTSLDVGDSKCKARTKNCGLQLMDKTLTDLIFNGLKTALLKDTLSPANTISNLTINYIKKGEKIL